MSAAVKAPPKPRGFAVLWQRDPARALTISQAGGKAAHARGTAHEWTAKEARAAGRIGGLASRGGRGKPVP